MTHLLTSLVLVVLFVAAARAFPARPEPRGGVRNFDPADVPAMRWKLSLGSLAASGAFAYLVRALLEYVARTVHAPREPGEIVWAPTAALLWLPAILLGLLAGSALVEGMVASRDEELLEALREHGEAAHGVSFRRLGPPLTTLVLLGCGALVVMALTCSIRLGEGRIVEDPLLPGRAVVHRYADVRGVDVTTAPPGGGRRLVRPELQVRFADGHVLRSSSVPVDLDPVTLARAAGVVRERAAAARPE